MKPEELKAKLEGTACGLVDIKREAVLQFQRKVFHLTENGVFACPLLSDSHEGAKTRSPDGCSLPI